MVHMNVKSMGNIKEKCMNLTLKELLDRKFGAGRDVIYMFG
jgi:hypothetical protein